MGRTVPSYRMVIETEIQKWEGFLRALRGDDKAAFEELMNACRLYSDAGGMAVRPIPIDAMIMSMLLSHQQALRKIQKSIEDLEACPKQS